MLNVDEPDRRKPAKDKESPLAAEVTKEGKEPHIIRILFADPVLYVRPMHSLAESFFPSGSGLIW